MTQKTPKPEEPVRNLMWLDHLRHTLAKEAHTVRDTIVFDEGLQMSEIFTGVAGTGLIAAIGLAAAGFAWPVIITTGAVFFLAGIAGGITVARHAAQVKEAEQRPYLARLDDMEARVALAYSNALDAYIQKLPPSPPHERGGLHGDFAKAFEKSGRDEACSEISTPRNAEAAAPDSNPDTKNKTHKLNL